MSDARIVTLLFTDLVGSTELIARLGEERAEELRRTHFRLLRDAVAGGGGQEVKNLGDGLMVVFPSAVEAVACAVQMQRAMAGQNRARGDRALAVRVGLHVGEPIRDEDDYFGSAVVVAKRLCDSADGGQIRASDLVRGLVGSRGGFGFHSLGLLELKGLTEAIGAYEVAWEPEAVCIMLPPTLPPTDAARLVGRTEELARLRECWEKALAGGLRLALVAGEPGIGKTRLAAELAREAHAAGAVVLFGRCYDEALVPYQPFVEALRHYVAACPADALRAHAAAGAGEIVRLVPEMADRLPGLPEPLQAEPETERYRMFEAVLSLLAGAAADAPVMLILDDLHWADAPTLLLLKHIVRAPERAPFLVVATYRETELGRTHPLAEALGELRRERLFERISLRGLGEEDVASLLRAHVGSPPPEGLAAAVHAETEGNPFFVEEVARHLRESGALTEDGWRPGLSVEHVGIPEGVKEVIGRRLSRLSEACNRALQIASVVGREFGLDVLEPVSGSEGVDELLEEALDARLIEEVPGAVGRYSFSHALIRETLYEELSTTRRIRLHRRIAETLEALSKGPDADERLEELAHHFLEAAEGGDASKAVDYATRAGDRALALLAYEEAARHYEAALQALELIEPRDERRACVLMLAAGDAWRCGGRIPLANRPVREAIGIVRTLGDPAMLGSAALLAADVCPTPAATPDPWLLELLDDAISALGETDPILQAKLMGRLAEMLIWVRGSEPRRRELSDKAVATARRVGDPAAIALALHTMMIGYTHGAIPPADRLAWGTEITELSQRAGDRERALLGRRSRMIALLELGDMPAVEAEIDTIDAEATDLRQPLYLWFVPAHQAMLALIDGRLEEAESLAARAAEMGRRAGDPLVIGIYGPQMFRIRREQGRTAEVEEGTLAAVERHPIWRAAAVALYADLGRRDELLRELDRIVPDVAELSRNVGMLSIAAHVAEAAAWGSHERAAQVVLDVLAPHGDQVIVLVPGSVCYGSASHYAGLCATVLGRFDEAERSFASALAMHERMGARALIAHTRHEYARMLCARGARGDRDRAAELNRSALEIVRACGMPALERRAEALL